MLTHNLGYPRIGNHRELKKACEQYWAGQIDPETLEQTGKRIRSFNWELQKQSGIDWIPCNDFSFYDHVLDTCLMTGAIPARYRPLVEVKQLNTFDLVFAMARGYQQDGYDITAMEMTKWFDTNYHYIVPEFEAGQQFSLFPTKVISEFLEAKSFGIPPKPVILGPISFLLLGKAKEKKFNRLDLIDNLIPVYFEMLQQLGNHKCDCIQFDEPCLSLDLTKVEQDAFLKTYHSIRSAFPQIQIVLASYFDCYGANLNTAIQLPVDTLHVDLVRCPSQLDDILQTSLVASETNLSLGIVDGRNVWKNNFKHSLQLINKVVDKIGYDRVWIAPSCSLLHSPCDLDMEVNMRPEIKLWISFARQKLDEVVVLKRLACGDKTVGDNLRENIYAHEQRNISSLIHNHDVKERVKLITEKDVSRKSPFNIRKHAQRQVLGLPLYPTTTIGSFPQTKEIRNWRAKWKAKELTDIEYNKLLKEEMEQAVRWQEDAGIDVLVHGEFERNDMVEYFGEKLAGFAFTEQGWVQSYGSRCVKPPVIYGDVYRPKPMTVTWTSFAQSLTKKWMKGMLTGPVTILQWSFVRDDQPRSETCTQIALAIRDEVLDLEKMGIRIIQIDEPAIREGLPLQKKNWQQYLEWAVNAFRIASSGVEDQTQIHTHMCYSEFSDIIENIARMDADVITIETSRSQMELLNTFADFKYPNEIGPGVYDIHSPRIPSKNEIVHLLEKAKSVVSQDQLWVNPDCGLKTRRWEETKAALIAMVDAARELRQNVSGHPLIEQSVASKL